MAQAGHRKLASHFRRRARGTADRIAYLREAIILTTGKENKAYRRMLERMEEFADFEFGVARTLKRLKVSPARPC